MYRVLLMAMLLVQSTVTSAGGKFRSPTDHGKKDCTCTCICEVNSTSLPLACPTRPMVSSTPASTTLASASGFAVLPRALYKFYGCESGDTWSNANETCAKSGAHLAVPETMSEVYMLLGMLVFHIHPESDCSIFIGLEFRTGNSSSSGGEFRTVLGDPMPMVLRNLWGERELPKENRCLTFSREGEIEVEDCEESYAYACKLPAD